MFNDRDSLGAPVTRELWASIQACCARRLPGCSGARGQTTGASQPATGRRDAGTSEGPLLNTDDAS